MFFHNVDYPVFLLVAVVGFWLLRRGLSAQKQSRVRNTVSLFFIFVLSCLFYMSRHPYYIVLILGSTVVDYIAGAQIAKSDKEGRRKFWLLVSLVFNLGLLVFFKYYNFIGEALEDTASVFGGEIEVPILDMAVPVGISFYTFQTLSYTIDIYRRKLEPEKGFVPFGFFVTYFPQLVSGPIVRAVELLPQLREKLSLKREQVSRGVFLIGVGLVKKVAVADFLQVGIVNRVFDDPARFTASEVVVALYAFTMQIYCDFSGYTDMARGSAKLMGLELPRNFDRPYQATNPADFWRRWHMTLSSWLRDYLYFPLGGSRVPEVAPYHGTSVIKQTGRRLQRLSAPARPYINLWLTMFIIGIWHGAGYTFVFYGALQGTAMVVHRYFRKRSGRARDAADTWQIRALKIAVLLQFVVFSRIFFRATSWKNAMEICQQLGSGLHSVANVAPSVWAVLLLSFAAHYVPKSAFEALYSSFKRLHPALQAVVLAILGAAVSEVASSEALPYIYDQF